MSKTTRIEKDSMGELEVPVNALYGAQTQRAVNNFPISGLPMPRAFIEALGLIKYAAAKTNAELGLIAPDIAFAIETASLDVAAGKYDSHFPVDVFQTGSGTSSNMNANEVIASLANQPLLQGKVHPNDHVNCSQSSNDVIPTAIHVSSALAVTRLLLPALEFLEQTLNVKAQAHEKQVKMGRTHLMDALPVTLGQELHCWEEQVRGNARRIREALHDICALAQGGTAVGTGVNAPPQFSTVFAQYLSAHTNVAFRPAANRFERISTQDSAVVLSGTLRSLAVSIMKISNDLRWMNSGPIAGLGEITLPSLQAGSSIMPGKVNPVIPEAACMVAAQVMGNDATIAIAGQSGNFQLNVMLPVIAYNLLQSIELLSNTCHILADKAIKNFTVNYAHINNGVTRNPILITALNPFIGYDKGAQIAKKAYAEARPVLDVALEMTDLDEKTLKELLDPYKLT